ncbi:glycoside hydrolase family 3 [Fusarium tjaetaba]|uniref:beta-glucosidase n=1 Tax=Fusarium tjaetaba TaxID=1567544 RepID=A0A8H5SGW9_9HYPO|nr:glycoside hydrolase family 3 [Fusarium tjaetaba]KAF5651403.1 glycoside hydrolase family 3 [Fusarium tjaetaba]
MGSEGFDRSYIDLLPGTDDLVRAVLAANLKTSIVVQPVRNEDNPAFLNYISQRNRVIYDEDVFMGYRFYESSKREVAFPFGDGLSYTTFELSLISVDVDSNGDSSKNLVMQVCARQKSPSLIRPIKEPKCFDKVFVRAGETATAIIKLAKRYVASFWDEGRDAWAMKKGKYELLIADSNTHTPLSATFPLGESR